MKQLTLTLLLWSFIYTDLSIAAPPCDPNMTADTVNSRYTMQTNGTVIDKQTGLTWMRCALGQTWDGSGCKGLPQTYTWKSALATAETTRFMDQNDWRLPEQEELQSLVENRCYRPFINLAAFPNPTDNWFWSASPNPSNIGSMTIANFFYDYLGFGNKKDSYAIRLVRGG
jgi:hypothetical protein